MQGLPAKLGPFIIEAELGRGGMGVVYLAKDPGLDRPVAIKVLGEGIHESPDRLARFTREARALAQLNHPNIAAVYGLHEHLGRQLLVMEYVPGHHLGERSRPGAPSTPTTTTPPMPPAQALALGVQIAAGLGAAHRAGIVHRDLKPANIRLRPDGVIKLLDFGLARVEPAQTDHASPQRGDDDQTLSVALTEAGRVLGTAGYMSPEQARGKPVDQRADVWAFGVVLFELLTGERAFHGETPMDSIVAIIGHEPPWDALPHTTPHQVALLLRRCLEKDPARRLGDITDARHELEDALAELTHHRPHLTHAHAQTLPSALAPGPRGNAHGPDTALITAAAPLTPANKLGSASSSSAGTSTGTGGPSHLPRPLSSFIGRASCLAEARALLERSRLLTIAGSGGVGKTRLAIKLAHRVGDSAQAGAFFVDVAEVKDPALVGDEIAARLGLTPGGPGPIEAIADAIQDRPLLIVLDNAEAQLQAVRDAARALLAACPALRLLVTSREPVGLPGETVYRLAAMRTPWPDADDPASLAAHDAVALFLDRAAAARPGFSLTPQNAPAIAEICRQLDGLPLAVELAAARVKLLSPQQILERLGDRFTLLGPGRRGGSGHGRHRALEQAIAWSFDQLESEERAAFCRVCVFCGGLTLSGAEAVIAGPVFGPGGVPEEPIEPAESLHLLAQLVDKSMIQFEDAPTRPKLQGPLALRPRDALTPADPTRGAFAEADHHEPRYTILETIRQYGLRRLAESGELDSARHRHLDWVASIAARAESGLAAGDERPWFDRLEVEHPNIRAALSWVIQGRGDHELGRRIASAVWPFWIMRGHIAEGRARLIDLDRLSAQGPPSASVASLRAGIARIAIATGDLPTAVAFGRSGLQIARAVSDRATVAGLLNGLGAACAGDGIPDRAIDYLEESLAIRRALAQPLPIADSLSRLGEAQWAVGDRPAATRSINEAEAILRDFPGSLVLAQTLARKAWHTLDAARPDAAPTDPAQLEPAQLEPARLDLARVTADAALQLLRSLSAQTEYADAIELAACIAAAHHLDERAARLFGAAQGLRARMGTPVSPRASALTDPWREALASRLSEDRVIACAQEGAEMKPARALRYALEAQEAPLHGAAPFSL